MARQIVSNARRTPGQPGNRRILYDGSQFTGAAHRIILVIAGILASAYSAEGQKDVALRMIRRAAWQYESMRKPMPVDLHIQTCWILMESGEDANLNTELMSLTARKDLTSQQTAGVQQIWVAWSQKKAERFAALGEYHQALSVLYAARQAFPADPGLRSSFANMLCARATCDAHLKIMLRGDW